MSAEQEALDEAVYTPTTSEVRNRYRKWRATQGVGATGSEFDRWLASHDAEVAARDAETIAGLRGEVEHQRKMLAKRRDIVHDLTDAHDGVVRDLMAIHQIAAEQRARADAAETKVRAVEALADFWAKRGWPMGASELRAALATPEPTVQVETSTVVRVRDGDGGLSILSVNHAPGVSVRPAPGWTAYTPLNPDCAAGNKHRACAGDAWDEATDSPTSCACPCHKVRP